MSEKRPLNLHAIHMKEKRFIDTVVINTINTALIKTVIAPIERIKILLQTQRLKPPELRYTSLRSCLAVPTREGGVFAFWRGHVTNMLRYIPSQILLFALYTNFKSKWLVNPLNYSREETIIRLVVAGGSAGLITHTILYPFDVLRTRITADIGITPVRKYNRLGETFIKCIHPAGGGLLTLYNGFVASTIGAIFYRILYFGGYEYLKMSIPNPSDASLFSRWTIAQSAVFAAQTITYPIETLRRRMMVKNEVNPEEGFKWDLHMENLKREKPITRLPRIARVWSHGNAMDIINSMFKEGFSGVFRGFSMNLIRSISAALFLAFYDKSMDKYPGIR